MAEKIPYWGQHPFFGYFVRREGAEGCEICPDARVMLSMERKPPTLRDQAPPPRERKPPKTIRQIREERDERLFAVLNAPWKVMDAIREVKAWARSPTLPVPVPVKVVEVAASKWMADTFRFDLQDIPTTIRLLGMGKAAKMFDKWFAGDLNYSPTENDSRLEINQKGEPYPPRMIDKDSITYDWVFGFDRAAASHAILINERIYSDAAVRVLRAKLKEHAHRSLLNTITLCGEDIQMLHKNFQFQYAPVEGTLAQKYEQYSRQNLLNLGIPDELTLILGSFNVYAAISRVVFTKENGKSIATITHIYVYVRDGFTFTDAASSASQYLGHWGRKGIAIVLAKMASSYVGKIDWLDYPVIASAGRGVGVFYPVKNSDFRRWQLENNQGGDYMIYSNKKSIFLTKPIVVVLS